MNVVGMGCKKIRGMGHFIPFKFVGVKRSGVKYSTNILDFWYRQVPCPWIVNLERTLIHCNHPGMGTSFLRKAE